MSNFENTLDWINVTIYLKQDSFKDFFSTSASVMAGLLAIIFSISLVVVEIGSNRYSFGILRLFWKARITIITLGTGIAIILLSMLFLGLDLNLNLYFYLILGLFAFWMFLFVIYYNYMIKITNYEGLLKILDREVNLNIKINNDREIKQFLRDIKDTILKAARTKEDDQVFKFCNFFQDIYYKFQNLEKNDLKFDFMYNYQMILSELISLGHIQRIYELTNIYSIPAHEIIIEENQKRSQIDYNFLQYFYSFLFQLNKEIIDNDDAEAFIESIDSYTLLNPGFPTSWNNIFRLEQELSEKIREEYYEHDLTHEYFSSIYCLQELSDKKLIYDFEYIHNISIKLDGIFNGILNDANLTEGLSSKIKEFKDEFTITTSEFYIYYNFLETYIFTGSYILYKYKNEKLKISKYLLNLWDRTNPKSNQAISLNESPVTYDLEVLTGLFLFGGRKNGYRYTPISIRFDRFLESEYFIKHYYILFVTWILENKHKDNPKFRIQSDNCIELNKYYYKYSENFQYVSEELIKICEEYIKDNEEWKDLFVNPKSAFEKTKEWINSNTEYCKKKSKEILLTVPIDSEKIDSAKENILDEYLKENQISKISQIIFKKENDEKEIREFQVCPIRADLDRVFFIYNEYLSHTGYSADGIRNLGKLIANCELKYLIDKIESENNLQFYDGEISNYEEINDIVPQEFSKMKDEGFDPKVILIPRNFYSKFILETKKRHLLNNDGERIPIILTNNHNVNSLFLIDPSSGNFIYQIQEENERINIITDEFEDKMKFCVSSKFFYEVVNKKAILKIKISEYLIPDNKKDD